MPVLPVALGILNDDTTIEPALIRVERSLVTLQAQANLTYFLAIEASLTVLAWFTTVPDPDNRAGPKCPAWSR